MQMVRKINEELAIAGQITAQQLQEIAQEGYKSVLNLRLPEEKGFLTNENLKAEFLGLYYVHLPTKMEMINPEVVRQILKAINELPKPALIHCDSAMRSAAIALMYIATKQGIPLEQTFQQATKLGLLYS